MDIKTLITFKTIIETGSFQKAAIKLNYAQSTITTQMQSLENELDVKLFDKIGRKMMLTQGGKDLLPSITSMIDTYQNMKNYTNLSNNLTGELHIGIAESLLTYQIQPILKAFHEQAPDVKIYFKVLNCFDIPQEIEHGHVDVGIYYDNHNNTSNLKSHKLKQFNVSVVGSSLLKEDYLDFYTKEQALHLSLISDDPNSIYQKEFDKINKQKNVLVHHKIEVTSIETIKKSVISNLGIAILPAFVYQEELSKNLIKELTSDLDDFQIDAMYSCHKNKSSSPALNYFIQLLEDFFMST